MPRSGSLGTPKPYTYFATFAGLSFWPGGLTLLSAAPGVGKTSWLLRIVFDAACSGVPAAIGCYEHTPEEMKYRLQLQSEAAVAGPHDVAYPAPLEMHLARGSEAVLLSLSDQDDTVRGVEEMLIRDYGFPEKGQAIVAFDYLQRMPVAGLTAMLSEDKRAGEAAASLRALARRRGWALIVAAALRAESFADPPDLSALLGDERVPYEADRVLLVQRAGAAWVCGCADLDVHTLKDRTGPQRVWRLTFWGSRFYPTPDDSGHRLHTQR